jgi:hypothetical protein
MGVFKRGSVWWFTFRFRGQRIQESTSSTSKTLAIRAERERRRQLEEGVNRLKADKRPMIFSVYSKHYLEANTPHWSPSNVRIETYNAKHLAEHFGKSLLTDITPADIAKYQAQRKADNASSRTINMEVGTLRAILRKQRLWANLQPDVKMLRARSDIGRALSRDEETRLLKACKASRSRSLYPAVLLSIHTGLRNQELRLMRWRQVNMLDQILTVGKSKTSGGEGRTVPLSATAWCCVLEWRSQWSEPNRSTICFLLKGTGWMVNLDVNWEPQCPTKLGLMCQSAHGRLHGRMQNRPPESNVDGTISGTRS